MRLTKGARKGLGTTPVLSFPSIHLYQVENGTDVLTVITLNFFFLGTTTCSEPVLYKNWLLTGTKVKEDPKTKTRTAAVCWSKCQDLDECNFISWTKKTHICIRLVNIKKGKKKKGVTSGPLSSCD